MSYWKCGICNKEFENYQAEGFDGKIYCPLCYYKKIINDVSTYLEYYLIDNLKYEDSQEEFKKLLKMLNKGSEEE